MKNFFTSNYRWFPILLLCVCVGVYGVYLTQLGFYWDDWLVINLTTKYNKATELFYFPNRPLHAWLDILGRTVLGVKPLHWHLVMLTLRWLAVWSMWEVLRRIWPKREEAIAWMAVMFSVYPIFFQQATATLFRPHWICYTLFFFSVAMMIQAFRTRKYFWVYTLLGMLATAGHLFTTEYMAGLEFARPVILWIIIAPETNEVREKIKTVIKNWLPYLIVYIVFFGYRILFYPGENDPNPLIQIDSNKNAFDNLLELALASLKDILHVLVTSWADILHPDVVIDVTPGNLLAWAIAISISAVVYYAFTKAKNTLPEKNIDTWAIGAVLFGSFCVFVGLIPIWLTGSQVLGGRWSDRYSIAALFGASIFIVAFLYLIISKSGLRRFAFAVLLAIAISAQIRAANDFRWDWIRQTRSYWQMYWRAPAIEPNTPIITDGAFTSTVSRYNATFAINLLYPQDEESDFLPYWYFEVTFDDLDHNIPEILAGKRLNGNALSEKFSGKSKNAIIINTPSRLDQCLWFLTPRDVNNDAILAPLRDLAPVVNLDRILREPIADDYPNEDIFGQEPEHTWCYYFQKASLARQFEDWEEVIRLWDEAEAQGFRSSRAYELLPFIEAFAKVEDWDKAIKLSEDAQALPKGKSPMVCAFWEEMRETLEGNEDFDAAYEEAIQTLKCSNP
jgi:hypothetical protein